MDKRVSLRERLNSMSPEELRAALRATAKGDRTHRATWLATINPSYQEAMAIWEENQEVYAAATAEAKSKN